MNHVVTHYQGHVSRSDGGISDCSSSAAILTPVSSRLGFTLVELLVVIAIISILIGLLLPALAAAEKVGRAALCANNERQIGVSFDEYASDWQDNLPNLQEYYAWWVGTGWNGNGNQPFETTVNPLGSFNIFKASNYGTNTPYGILQCPEEMNEHMIKWAAGSNFYNNISYAINVNLVRSAGHYGINYPPYSVIPPYEPYHLRLSSPQARPDMVYLGDGGRFNTSHMTFIPTDPYQLIPSFSVGQCQSLVPGIYGGSISYGIGSTVFAPLAIHPGPSLNCLFLDFHVESVLSSKFATSVNPYSGQCIWSEP